MGTLSDPEFEANFMNFKKSCLNFYSELVTQIKKRFDFSDPVFEMCSIVNPKVALSYEIKTLYPILERFPVLKVINLQTLDNEWREHALLDVCELGLNPQLPAQELLETSV